MTETVTRKRSPLGTRAKPGLILSIGQKADKGHPVKLDYFRAKPGPFTDRFAEVFGKQPKEIRVCPPSNVFGDMIDIRWKAFAGGGPSKPDGGYLKALGRTNYAEVALAGDRERMSGEETLDGWNQDGTKGEFKITGPDDPMVAKLKLKVTTTLRFLVPEVLGVGAWAEISTGSEQSTHSLYRTLAQIYRATQGQWFGLDLVLYLQEARSRPVVDGKQITSKFWMIAVRSPYSVVEFIEQRRAIAEIQAPAPLPALDHGAIEREEELHPGLWETGEDRVRATVAQLPVGSRETVRTREEPSAVDRPDDALLNRIATLRAEVGLEAADTMLLGSFGCEVEQMNAGEAAAYAAGLERIAEARVEHVADADVEILEDNETGETG